MMPIITYPSDVLSMVCESYDDFGAPAESLFEEMVSTMYGSAGIGLAAPQVGILKRFIVLETSVGRTSLRMPIAMINPVVKLRSDIHEIEKEGCLSIPGVHVGVSRSKFVSVEYFDLQGNKHEQNYMDLVARIIQHEIDHLDGKIMLDRLGSKKRKIIEKEMNK